jgi:hypothetical protein
MFILIGAGAILWLIFQGFVVMFHIVMFLLVALFSKDDLIVHGEQATGKYWVEE